jgi:hypothetical protein
LSRSGAKTLIAGVRILGAGARIYGAGARILPNVLTLNIQIYSFIS